MTMSKRNYELIAEIVSRSYSDFRSNTAHAYFASYMARALKTDNDNFNKVRFIRACMPEHLVGSAKGHVPWERLAEVEGKT